MTVRDLKDIIDEAIERGHIDTEVIAIIELGVSTAPCDLAYGHCCYEDGSVVFAIEARKNAFPEAGEFPIALKA